MNNCILKINIDWIFYRCIKKNQSGRQNKRLRTTERLEAEHRQPSLLDCCFNSEWRQGHHDCQMGIHLEPCDEHPHWS